MRHLLLIAASLTAASCNSIVCGDGTFADGDTCIGWDPNDMTAPTTTATPAGGRSRDPLPPTVVLESDESAKIYYTTDGTDPDPTTATGETSPVTIVEVTQGMTLKWLAVDRAGNREEIKTATFDSDTIPPSPPTSFAVTLSGTTAQLSWTPPTDADYAGVAVARVLDVVDVGPTPGMMLSAGMLSSSVQVLQAGTGTSASDPGRQPGPIRYLAWAYDDLGNFSAPVVAIGSLPVGALGIQLTYDTTAMSLAMPTTPDNISLTGTTASLSGTTLTVSLNLTNNTTKYFHNFKAEVTATTNASFTNADGTADTFSFKSYGPALFAPGASVTRDLTFTVVDGQTATIDITLADHATLAMANASRSLIVNLLDLGTGTIKSTATSTIIGPNESTGGNVRRPVLTGQRYLDVPHTHGAIERFDLVTGMRTGFAPIGIGERANVQWVHSTGGELLALIKRGGKRNKGKLELFRVDESLKIRGQLELNGTEDQGFSQPALAPDNRTLAFMAGQAVVLVDLNTFTQIDVLPATAAVDNIGTGLDVRGRGPLWFDNGNGLLVMAKQGGKVAILKKNGTAWTSTIYQDANTGRGYHLGPTADGKIWVAQQTGLREFNPAGATPAEMFTTIAYPNPPYAINVLEGQTWITRQTKYQFDQVSETGAVLRTITLATNQRAVGHWIAAFR